LMAPSSSLSISESCSITSGFPFILSRLLGAELPPGILSQIASRRGAGASYS
jgi:hypothetical protein